MVGADADGNLTAVWAGDGAAGYGVYTAKRAATATSSWSAATKLASVEAPASLHLAVHASGLAVAGWTDTEPSGNRTIVLTTRGANGTWAAASSVSTGDPSPLDQQFTIDGAGRVVGVSTRQNLLIATAAPTGGKLAVEGAPESFVSGGERPFDLAIDGAGTATLVYVDASDLAVQTATRPAGGEWSTPTAIEEWAPAPPDGYDPDGDDVFFPAISLPQLSVTADGRALAVWQRADGIRPSELRSATRSAAGTWSTPATIETLPNRQGVFSIDASMDASGRRTVLWAQIGETTVGGQQLVTSQVKTIDAPANGPWGSASALSPREESPANQAGYVSLRPFNEVELALGSDGRAIAIAKLAAAPVDPPAAELKADLQGAVRTKTGAWEPWSTLAGGIVLATDDADPAAVAVDKQGLGTLVWADGRTVRSRTVALTDPPKPADPGTKDPDPVVKDPDPVVKNPDPVVKNPDPVVQDPAPDTPAPSSPAPNGTAPQTPTKGAPPAKLAISLYVLPSGRKCPAVAAATVDGVRTNLKVTKTKLRKKLACKVTGTVVLKPSVKVGTKVSVLITAKGIKRKSVQLPAAA